MFSTESQVKAGTKQHDGFPCTGAGQAGKDIRYFFTHMTAHTQGLALAGPAKPKHPACARRCRIFSRSVYTLVSKQNRQCKLKASDSRVTRQPYFLINPAIFSLSFPALTERPPVVSRNPLTLKTAQKTHQIGSNVPSRRNNASNSGSHPLLHHLPSPSPRQIRHEIPIPEHIPLALIRIQPLGAKRPPAHKLPQHSLHLALPDPVVLLAGLGGSLEQGFAQLARVDLPAVVGVEGREGREELFGGRELRQRAGERVEVGGEVEGGAVRGWEVGGELAGWGRGEADLFEGGGEGGGRYAACCGGVEDFEAGAQGVQEGWREGRVACSCSCSC